MPPRTARKRDDKHPPLESEPLVDVEVNPVTVDEIEYVKLVSCDGFEFLVRKDFALTSHTISNMLDAYSFLQDSLNVIVFYEIRGCVLEKVCHYLSYKTSYSNTNEDIPLFPIDNDIAIELLIASNFLDC